MNSLADRFFKLPVYVHILSVTAFFCVIVILFLHRLDAYTNHNQAVIIPDVKGLQVEDAVPLFEKNMLRYVIIDSIFSKEVKPGAIVELMPEVNSKVKKNRIVYITINAKTEEMAPLPDVKDISYRQAYAIIKSRGFINVEIKYVSSEFRDLAIGVEYGGKFVQPEARIPLNAKLTLVLGDGHIDQTDSINEQQTEIIDGNESWF
jgi:hypothetical protein